MAYIQFNPNPKGNYVGDCVVRAISKILNQTWSETYVGLCVEGFKLGDMPSSNRVWETYLLNKGYKKFLLPNNCPNCYTVEEFSETYPDGSCLLATGTHVVAVCEGNYYDSWPSGDEVISYLFRKE